MTRDEDSHLMLMKQAWREMDKSLRYKNCDTTIAGKLKDKKTALDRLKNKYQMFLIASLAFMFGTFTMFYSGLISDSPLNPYLSLTYAAYFLLTFSMDLWLWSGIGSIDPLTMSVNTVARKASYYRRRHLQFIGILLPLAIALLGFTFYTFINNRAFLIGMFAGIIFGIIAGSIQLRRFLADYRDLSDY